MPFLSFPFKKRHKVLVGNIHSKNSVIGLKLIRILGYGILLAIMGLSIYNYYSLDSEYIG